MATGRPNPRPAVGAAAVFWQKVLRALHAAAVYALLGLLCLFILLPIGWMLTAALTPDTAPIFTFPPEWFPTQYWHWPKRTPSGFVYGRDAFALGRGKG